jgi:hypothetical protein
MKYKGIVGAWKKTEVNTPAVKLLSIVTDTKENTEVIGPCFLPSMKSPIKSYGSNDCSISSNVLSPKRL